MAGRDHTLPCSMVLQCVGVLLRPAVTAPHRRSLSVTVLLCSAILVCSILAAPADAAGFQKGDCSCQVSGFSLSSQQPIGTTQLGCIWTRKTGSSSETITVLVTKYASNGEALTPIRNIKSTLRSAVDSDRNLYPGHSCLEETFSDTRVSAICKPASLYYGMRDVLYRDAYVIELSTPGAQFSSGQDLKSSFDQLESCMKRAADAHAGIVSGAATTIPAGASQGVPSGSGTTTGGTGTTGEPEDSLDDILRDMGDEINEDLPLPVNWTAVPEALSASVTPAAAGALGALAGSLVGALALIFNGAAWSPYEGGGAGGRAPGGQPGTAHTKGEPETTGQPGSKPVQMITGAIAKDRPVDKLGIPPLPENGSGQIPARISVPVPDLHDPGVQFCGNCGTPRRTGAAFCGNCGAKSR